MADNDCSVTVVTGLPSTKAPRHLNAPATQEYHGRTKNNTICPTGEHLCRFFHETSGISQTQSLSSGCPRRHNTMVQDHPVSGAVGLARHIDTYIQIYNLYIHLYMRYILWYIGLFPQGPSGRAAATLTSDAVRSPLLAAELRSSKKVHAFRTSKMAIHGILIVDEPSQNVPNPGRANLSFLIRDGMAPVLCMWGNSMSRHELSLCCRCQTIEDPTGLFQCFVAHARLR